MDERKNKHCVPWDESQYTTGSTKPPKSHGALVAALCIFCILLVGIVSMLSVMNVRMFQKLREERRDLVVSFDQRQTNSQTKTQEPTLPAATEAPRDSDCDITLHPSPEGAETETGAGALSLQEIYEQVRPSVVSVVCTTQGGSSTGSGVILSEDGYLVTNQHVISGATAIEIILSDDSRYPATVVGSDSVADLAVLSIQAENLTAAQFGDSEKLRVGDTVAAIGDPLGVSFRGTLTNGIVSAISRDVTIGGREMTLIQTNAALNSGNSGGPLINCYGQIVGINTAKIADYADTAGVEGLGFAIPSTTVKEIVSQLLSQGYVSGRPYLGIHLEELTGFYQRFYKIPAGLYISSVDENSPAAQAGITRGDLLLEVDGESVTSTEDFSRIFYNHQPGDTLDLTIYRAGYRATIRVTLAEATG